MGLIIVVTSRIVKQLAKSKRKSEQKTKGNKQSKGAANDETKDRSKPMTGRLMVSPRRGSGHPHGDCPDALMFLMGVDPRQEH